MFMGLKNKKGNAIMQVLIAMMVMSISFYFLATYVISQKKQIVKTKNVVNLKFAVNSAMDYVIFGIRQKYCFDDDTLLQNTSSCDWLHKGSVERLVMSDEQLQNLASMVASGVDIGAHDSDLSKLRLDSIDLTLKFPVAASHPLFPIVNNLKKVVSETSGEEVVVKGIHVVINRPANAGYLPKAGREVYVTAVISLVDKDGNILQIGRAPLTVTSQIAVYPREMGSFALVLPGNLHMDQAWNAAPAQVGDVMFHKFANRSAIANSPGLVFLSPVFVNADIYLPSDTGNAANSNYSAVTFADRVYMGNGWILNPNGSPYSPNTSGSLADRYWSDSRVFGGFHRGIENDGMRDIGLDVMSGVSTGLPSGSYADNELCAALNKKSEDIDLMQLSTAKASLTSQSDDGKSFSNYHIGLSNYNQFYPQKNGLVNPDITKWGGGSYYRDDKGNWRGAIMNVVIGYGTGSDYREITTDLVQDGYIDAKPVVANATRKAALDASLKAAKASLDAATNNSYAIQDQIVSKKSEISKAQSSLDSVQASLSKEMAKPVAPPPSSSDSSSTGSSSSDSSSSSSSTDSSSTGSSSTGSSSTGSSSTGSSSTGSSSTGSSGSSIADTTSYRDEAKVKDLQNQIDTLNAKISSLQSDISDLQGGQTSANEVAKSTAQSQIAAYQAQIDDYNSVVNNPPVIRVDTDPSLSRSGRVYKDQVEFQVFITNAQSLRNSDGKQITNVTVKFKGYDGTYYNGQPISETADPTHLTGYLNFKIDATGKVTRPTGLASSPNASGVEGTVADDLADLMQRCLDYRKWADSQSFGGASWGYSFSGGTRKSWNFSGEDNALPADPVMPNKTWIANDDQFKVHSIIGNCVIQPQVTFVTGFYTCDNLTIQGGRSSPLRIIGTFIIGKSLKIDEQAIRTGISWSSIYYPQATQELRAKKILKSQSDPNNVAKCDSLPSPIWHPAPSIQETADRILCNVISLRNKADPFKWTAVDPDCGIPPGVTQTTTSCKKRIMHYYVVEQSREGSGL